MKLLHTADWQIGRIYNQFEPEDGQVLALERIEAVKRIAELASLHEVDVVLVAGDVFDEHGVRDKTIRRLFEATQGFKGDWLMLPGNHDAALPESVWTRARRLGAVPDNVTLCLVPETVVLAGKCAVLPAPLTQRHTHADLTAWFDTAETPEGLPRIGLAHGCASGILPSGVDSANPIAADRAATARLDYLALGDWHGKKGVDARTWYSGTHEPERFRDNDPGFVLVVEIAAAGAVPRVTPVVTAKYTWRELNLRIMDGGDADRAVQVLGEVDGRSVVSAVLSGTCDMATQQRLQQALQQAEQQAAAFTAKQDDLRLAPTPEDLHALQADGFVGEVLRELKDKMQGPQADAEVARDAMLNLARILQGQSGKAAAP